jgi:ketosteroid isomerase-like protein
MAEAMSERTSTAKVRARYDALLDGDGTAATIILDDGSVLHVPGRSGVAGDYQGQEAILGLFRWMAEFTHGTLRVSSSRLVAEDSRVLVLRGHISATAMRAQLDTDVIHALSLRGDKIQEAWIFSLNQDDFDAFWTGRRRTAADGVVGQSGNGTGISS